jgi:hypothetical protein
VIAGDSRYTLAFTVFALVSGVALAAATAIPVRARTLESVG